MGGKAARKRTGSSDAQRVQASGAAGSGRRCAKKRLEKEKRHNERKVTVDRMCYISFTESAGTIQCTMTAEQAAGKKRGAPERGQRFQGLGSRSFFSRDFVILERFTGPSRSTAQRVARTVEQAACRLTTADHRLTTG